MVRKGQGRQSLNASVVSVTNGSLLEDSEQQQSSETLEYKEFVKRFRRPDLEVKNKGQLIGYEKTITNIRDLIEKVLDSDSYSKRFALITGPSGTGKTTAILSLAEHYSSTKGNKPKLAFFFLEASWFLERQFGNPESRIRSLFDEAIQKAPSLIFIDEIDLICPEKRSQSDTNNRVLNVLKDKLKSLDRISARVLVLAATDRPEMLDPQIRKRFHFRNEIKFTLPSKQDRAKILRELVKGNRGELSDIDLDQVAESSHCYSYEDLSELCHLALDHCKNHNNSVLNSASFKVASKQVKPTATESITTPCPPLHWQDIGGVDNVKSELQKSVIWPLEHREKFQELCVGSNKGALLYGPPGCSKTMLAQALATESGYNFISIKGPELFSKWVGDSEAAVRRLYRNARDIAPCIIFFDEIDGFAPNRSGDQSSSVGEKVVAQLLTELNGIEPLDNVYTIAATNRPDRVETALLRPGRLDPAIYIPLPNKQDRREIFKVHMRPMPLNFGSEKLDEIFDKLAAKTSGFSGAEIAKVCRMAGRLALEESLDNKQIEWKHFEGALDKVKPRTKEENLVAYERFHERVLQLGSGGTSTNHHLKQQVTESAEEDGEEEPQRANSDNRTVQRVSTLNRLMRTLSLKRTRNAK